MDKSDIDWINGYFEGYESGVQSLHKLQPSHIDPESKQFIKWSTKRLSEPDYYFLVSSLIESQVKTFLHGNHQELLSSLKEKLSKGAREHGKPSYSLGQIQQELNQELLDLIGWNMVWLWNLRKGANANS